MPAPGHGSEEAEAMETSSSVRRHGPPITGQLGETGTRECHLSSPGTYQFLPSDNKLLFAQSFTAESGVGGGGTTSPVSFQESMAALILPRYSEPSQQTLSMEDGIYVTKALRGGSGLRCHYSTSRDT